VVVYLTLLLFGSVAMPLYVAYAVEQAARRRFCRRLAAADAGGGAGQGCAGWQQQQQLEGPAQQRLVNGVAPPASAGQELMLLQQQPQHGLQQQQLAGVDAINGYNADGNPLQFADPADPSLDFGSLSSIPNGIARWAVHLLLLLSMLLLCWSLSNLFALQLLPKLLSSQQLDLWCPNKPRPPFVMAGQVYTGGDY
jgi:hypothetical protein